MVDITVSLHFPYVVPLAFEYNKLVMLFAETYSSCLLLFSLQQFLKSCENINWVALLAPCCWPFSVLGGKEKRLIWSKLVALSGTACRPYSTLLYEQYHLDNFLCGVQRYDQVSGFGTVNESQNQENVLFNADSMLRAPSKSFSGLQSLFVKMHGLICFNWCGRQLSWLERLPWASIAERPRYACRCCLLTIRPPSHRCSPTCLQLRATWCSHCSLALRHPLSCRPIQLAECAIQPSDFNQHYTFNPA